jgi:hypothetical protein
MIETNETDLDLLETKSQYEKFVIYLPSKFFNKSSIFKSIYERIRKKFRNKGIMTYDIDKYAKILSQLNNYCNSIKDNLFIIANEFEHHPDVSINYLLKNKFGNEFMDMKFDDLDYPSTNVLYIHLFGGRYYNDKIYAKKKFDLERELLFFIAGNLGVAKITYTITNKETVITKIKADSNIQSIKNQVQYSKTYTEKDSSECTEIYENNGAPILFDSNGDIKKLEKEIKKSLEPINSPIFNYGFYKANPKMVAFVCKRFFFKMNILDYSSEAEDVSEMSITVQSCFADYGLQVAFESSTTTTEKVTYKLEFHKENDLLETYFQRKKYSDSAGDPFVMIRKFYDDDKSNNKLDSKNMIRKYIIGLSNDCKYKVKGCSTTHTFSKKLDEFINKYEARLSIKYKNFYTTRDIKKWFYDNLLNRNKEELADETFDNTVVDRIDIDLTNNHLEKTYEDKIDYLEKLLRETQNKIILYQQQNTEHIAKLELELKESRNILLEQQVSTETHLIHTLPTIKTHTYSQTKDKCSALYEDDNINLSSLSLTFAKEEPMTSRISYITETPIRKSIEESITQIPKETDLMPDSANILYQTSQDYPPSPVLSLKSQESINTPGETTTLYIEYPMIANAKSFANELIDEKEIQNKPLEELLIENENALCHYRKLHQTIEYMKMDIRCKKELLEKYKNENKDKITEQLIELSSSQNALQSLRSRKVMEQIKQTSSNKNLDVNEQDAFDKIKCMFSRSNVAVINLDKLINKTFEKCKKLEEDIAKNKNYLENIQNEIDKLTLECDNIIEERISIEQNLIAKGITMEQLNKIIQQFTNQFSNQIIEFQHRKSCIDNELKASSKNSIVPKSPKIKTKNSNDNNLARTLSTKSNNNIVIVSTV